MKNQATRLIRLPEVLERTGYGKSWIYRLINDGKFPAPVKIGSRAVAFVESEIDTGFSLLSKQVEIMLLN